MNDAVIEEVLEKSKRNSKTNSRLARSVQGYRKRDRPRQKIEAFYSLDKANTEANHIQPLFQ